MKKHLLITLILSLLVPSIAGTMIGREEVITIEEKLDNKHIINQLINEKCGLKAVARQLETKFKKCQRTIEKYDGLKPKDRKEFTVLVNQYKKHADTLKKGFPEKFDEEEFSETISLDPKKLTEVARKLEKELRTFKRTGNLNDFASLVKQLIQQVKKLEEIVTEFNDKKDIVEPWSKKRIALVLVPTLLAGAGVATWYYWDKIPVKTIRDWLSKKFASCYRRYHA